jgi:NAD(P)-dependent dehydrogenase (short-subunit alcohol dehydrogenase family)
VSWRSPRRHRRRTGPRGVAAAEGYFDGIDVLVNNAGIGFGLAASPLGRNG